MLHQRFASSAQAKADVFDYIECFHSLHMQRKVDAKDRVFRLVTYQSVRTR